MEFFEKNNKPVEAYRIKSRTEYDIEMMQEIGYCTGIENYSRFLSDRKSGERPYCLIDYMPGDFLTIIDESHVTLPQIRGMNRGDRARKSNLIDFGWRLPSAYDNRPLSAEEFNSLIGQEIFVSATPGDYEFNNSNQVIEQIIRPTGLTEPKIIIRPIEGQIDDLIERIRERVERDERILVTTLTKRMAEDLCNYLGEVGINVRYLHSDIDALDRVEILRELRLGEFDCLVGINLLREGLDLPEVSLVAILDADKEGFLRSEQALIQTCGRAARNVNGEVVLYADKITDSMRNAIEKITYRRNRQLEYNKKHGITPKTIKKAVSEGLKDKVGEVAAPYAELVTAARKGHLPPREVESLSLKLISEMELAAGRLDYEAAIQLRDQLKTLRKSTT